MHRALRIPEVVEIICHYLSPVHGMRLSKDQSHDLARLARSCKAFSEPALDILWSFQDTITRVLDCMPSGVWKTNDKALCRPILPIDWERPLFYICRVRRISCTDNSLASRWDLLAILEILRYSLPTQHLFPNLTDLYWMSDSLNTLDRERRNRGRYPSLYELDYLDQPAFEHIANLPSLRVLKLGLPQSLTTRVLFEPSFVALQHLELRSTQSQCIVPFIRATSLSPLASLILHINPLPEATVTTEIYTALEQYLPPASLTDLRITTALLPVQDSFTLERHIVGIDAIRHLFSFKNLTHVELDPPMGLDIDDTANCPELSTLKMSIDASVVPETKWGSLRIRQYDLDEFEVADSLISSAIAVAGFLSGLFPNLDEIHMNAQVADNHTADAAVILRKLWKEVEAAIPVCRAMRDEERIVDRTQIPLVIRPRILTARVIGGDVLETTRRKFYNEWIRSSRTFDRTCSALRFLLC
ncbi:hypothetical protein DFH07DRAFT_782424 [Mycena maculata]|uniref:F-box domain-containing protein n=1 Tax=Mycena maculata TaxID=230809 RepID=A0AAD7HSR5_9AGAR|nr:hypothetical protein DFH07DRAFT_782424 [Mycena maculata]